MNEFYEKVLNESNIPLDDIIAILEKNIINKDALNSLKIVSHTLKQNPVDKIKDKYGEFKKSSRAVTHLDVLHPFSYNDDNGQKKHIDPDISITKLLNSLDNTYLLLRDRTFRTIDAKAKGTTIFNSALEHDFWKKELSYNLNDMIKSSEEVGVWLYYISNEKEYDAPIVSSNFVRNRIKNKLWAHGIKNPESIHKDLRTAAIYVASYIRFMADERPKLY